MSPPAPVDLSSPPPSRRSTLRTVGHVSWPDRLLSSHAVRPLEGVLPQRRPRPRRPRRANKSRSMSCLQNHGRHRTRIRRGRRFCCSRPDPNLPRSALLSRSRDFEAVRQPRLSRRLLRRKCESSLGILHFLGRYRHLLRTLPREKGRPARSHRSAPP